MIIGQDTAIAGAMLSFQAYFLFKIDCSILIFDAKMLFKWLLIILTWLLYIKEISSVEYIPRKV